MGRRKARIDIESRWDDRGVKQAEDSLDRLHRAGRSALGGLKVAGIATGAAVGVGLAAAVATGTREMLEQEAVAAQTAARIKSTGAAANVTAKQIEAMASAQQAQTGIADDQIQAMQNLLLTFTNVRNEAGRGNDVFNQATRATLDLSVAFGKDLNSSAVLVGKALNDPINGLTALGRVGVQFTKDQKDQIKTLVESGRVMDAQKIILRELARETGGAAKAAGDTTQGQLNRIKRAWEDVSEGLMRAFLPIFSKIATAALRHMPEISGAFEKVGRVAAKILGQISRGDWEGVGKTIGGALIRGIGAGINAGIMALRDRLPGGRNGILAQALFGDITHFDARGLGLSVPVGRNPLTGTTVGIPTGGPRGSRTTIPTRRPGLATGGVIPGTYRGRDELLIAAAPGEVVLNPSQQEIVGVDRIMDALRRTGGVVGGDGFATGGVVGGVVQAAYQRATSKLGTPYKYGVWDCSKFATYVAGTGSGSTAWAWANSRPARGDEPIVWGFRNNADNDVYDGGPDEHMGVRVEGRWFDNGSGGVQSNADSARWEHVRVPKGLESLAASAGNPDTKANTRGRGTPQPTPRKRLANLFGRLGFSDTAANAMSGNLLGGVPDLSDGSAPSFTPAQDRSVSAAGRRARSEAMAAGKSPEAVAKAGEDAERAEEIRILNGQRARAVSDKARLVDLKQATLADFQRLGRKRVGEENRAAKKKAMAKYRAKLRQITAEINETRDEIADIDERLAEIGEQIKMDDYQERYDDAHATDPGGGDTGAAAPTGPTPDQQAQLDQANARAAAAEANAAGFGAFVDTLRHSGTIDPGMGGVIVIQNIDGHVIHDSYAASWVTRALGTQGAPVPGAFVSPA